MEMKVGQYSYCRRGNFFAIYVCTQCSEDGKSGTAMPTGQRFRDREEARRRVYELNGWTYRGPRK